MATRSQLKYYPVGRGRLDLWGGKASLLIRIQVRPLQPQEIPKYSGLKKTEVHFIVGHLEQARWPCVPCSQGCQRFKLLLCWYSKMTAHQPYLHSSQRRARGVHASSLWKHNKKVAHILFFTSIGQRLVTGPHLPAVEVGKWCSPCLRGHLSS